MITVFGGAASTSGVIRQVCNAYTGEPPSGEPPGPAGLDDLRHRYFWNRLNGPVGYSTWTVRPVPNREKKT